MSANGLAWLVGFVSLCVGFLVGYLIARRFSSDATQRIESEQRLQEAEDRLQTYKDDVYAHFRTTAELVNRLSEDYRSVHNHLAHGAAELCQQVGDTDLLTKLPESEQAPRPAPPEGSTIPEPPRDYAPPKSPNGSGILKEDYGIRNTSG